MYRFPARSARDLKGEYITTLVTDLGVDISVCLPVNESPDERFTTHSCGGKDYPASREKLLATRDNLEEIAARASDLALQGSYLVTAHQDKRI
jgi:hypothetical protein